MNEIKEKIFCLVPSLKLIIKTLDEIAKDIILETLDTNVISSIKYGLVSYLYLKKINGYSFCHNIDSLYSIHSCDGQSLPFQNAGTRDKFFFELGHFVRIPSLVDDQEQIGAYNRSLDIFDIYQGLFHSDKVFCIIAFWIFILV